MDKSTVYHLDSFFANCERDGQGISTKESAQMCDAVEALIREIGIGVVLDLDPEMKSRTGKVILRRALNNVVPGFSKLFV